MDEHLRRKRCMYVFRGNFVHSTSLNNMEIMADMIVGIDPTGKILFIEDGGSNQNSLEFKYRFTSKDIIFLKPRQFIIPGLVDTHIHAPQYAVTGKGYGDGVVHWLQKHIFPTEDKFEDLKFAQNVYKKVVGRLLKNGTTTASYFATNHYDATVVLCDIVVELGQRAHVGIVNRDRSLHHRTNTECCIRDTERFIKHVRDMKNPLLTPAITPRGIAHSSRELIAKHGEMAKAYDVPIQGHLREIRDELKSWASDTYWTADESSNLAKTMESLGGLTNKSYFAHCVYVSEEEIDILELNGVGVAHCPASNFDLKSGVADVRHLLDRKLKVGLGTDVSGGHSPSVLDALRQCITASNITSFNKPDSYKPLSYKEAFFLATLGGSEVLGLKDRIGNFEVGKEFDALLIDPDADDSPLDTFECDTLEDVIEKFLYLGDDRNILQVYVAGRPVSGRTLVSSYFSYERNKGIDIKFYSTAD